MKRILIALALLSSSAFAQTTMPDIRYWWTQDANQNGEYNYSTTTMSQGSTIRVANQWGDVPTGTHMTGPYGNTPVPKIDLYFEHNGYGYAEANLTTGLDNTGLEAESFAERDAGKVIAAEGATLNFSAPEPVEGVQVKLVDQDGRSSAAVNIKTYRSSYGRYAFTYAIPTSVFAGNDFDFDVVKSVTFFVDGSSPAGNYQLSVLGIWFQRN